MNLAEQDKTKQYSSIKYRLAIIDVAYLVILLFLFLRFGFSRAVAVKISGLFTNNYLVIALYFLIAYSVYYFLDFPLNFYRSFRLEHRFCLSNQKIRDWLSDQLKTGIISYILGLILLLFFYYILKHNPDAWWFIFSIFWIFFSLVVARLVPVLIIPLFFKYKKISDDALRQRIINLAQKLGVKILDVFEIDFSKKTQKANAAFVGLGKTKRVILADTLKDKYSYDEIEVILAHEFAHYRLRHLLKLLFVSSLTIILSFYAMFKTNNYFLGIFGFSSLLDVAALPVILMYLVVFGIIMQPFENYVSRSFERNADRMALEVSGLKDAFISMMEKLASQNLADRKPSKIVKFFFFDHPPIDERISMARNFMAS